LHDVQNQHLHELCNKDKYVNDDDFNNIEYFTTLKKILVVIDDVGTIENLVTLQDLVVNGGGKNEKK
jgi:Mg2+/Co2+ transporter CorB